MRYCKAYWCSLLLQTLIMRKTPIQCWKMAFSNPKIEILFQQSRIHVKNSIYKTIATKFLNPVLRFRLSRDITRLHVVCYFCFHCWILLPLPFYESGSIFLMCQLNHFCYLIAILWFRAASKHLQSLCILLPSWYIFLQLLAALSLVIDVFSFTLTAFKMTVILKCSFVHIKSVVISSNLINKS